MKYPSIYQRSPKRERQQEKDTSVCSNSSSSLSSSRENYVVKTTTIEGTLTRKLGIRFIDARSLATQAKINLDIFTYPSAEQERKIIEEAVIIFESKSAEDRISLLELNDELESAKGSTSTRTIISDNNSSLRSLETSGSVFSRANSSTSSLSSSRSSSRRQQSKTLSRSPVRSSERNNANSMSRAQKLVRMLSAKKL